MDTEGKKRILRSLMNIRMPKKMADDVVAVQVYDLRAKELPNVGLMRVVDAETGYEQYIDTSSRRLRQAHQQYWMNRQQNLRETMNKSNVDMISIATNDDYVKHLLMLFKQRS